MIRMLSLLIITLVGVAVAGTSNSIESTEQISHRSLADDLINPFIDGKDPVWWDVYRARYGKRAKRCRDVKSLPVNGTKCTKKKIGDYSCFFGEQSCQDESAHPQVKCDCTETGIWNCAVFKPCEEQIAELSQPVWTTCPPKHPLDFSSPLQCKSDFLVCNYGNLQCCGDNIAGATCECIGGRFQCFTHSTCRFRECAGTSTCPTKPPTVGDSCTQPTKSSCTYGEYTCCGQKFSNFVYHCFNNKWDIVTDILYNPDQCACGPPTPAPTPAPTPDPVVAGMVYRASASAAFPIEIPLISEDVLEAYKTDSELKDDLDKAAKYMINLEIERNANFDPSRNFIVQESVAFASADSTGTSPSAEGVSDFETNNQEEGVDEADLVKSDGKNVYAGYGDILVIWDAKTGTSILNFTLPLPEGQTLAPTPAPVQSAVEQTLVAADEPLIAISILPPGRRFVRRAQIQSMLLESDRLILFVNGYGEEARKETGRTSFAFSDAFNTRIMVFDTSKLPASLPLVIQKDVQGSFRDARAIGNNIHVVTTAFWNRFQYIQPLSRFNARYEGMTNEEYKAEAKKVAEKEVIPGFVGSILMEVTEGGLPNLSRISLWLGNSTGATESIFRDGIIQSYVQLTSFDVSADSLQFSTAGTFAPSSWGFTYAVGDMLVFAMQGWNWIPSLFGTGQTTYFLGFKLTGATATPHAIGSTPGFLLSQYSMDISQGFLRVATSIRQWWPNTPDDGVNFRVRFATQNQIIVLRIPDEMQGGIFKEVSRVGGLGKPQELFTTVRFFDKRAYAVTFQRTDPFYVIDVSDNLNPKVLGELEITGFSSYLHPINENNTLLIAVGQEADEAGRVLGLQISMFDAVDPQNPQVVQRFVVEQDTNVFSSSAVTWDFKAFRYVSLGVEVGILIMPLSIRAFRSGSDEGNFDGFKVFDISRSGIKERVEISHVESTRYFGCYWSSRLPQRSLVFDGNVTTIKGHSVLATDLNTGERRWKLNMPEPQDRNDCVFWYAF